MMKKLSAIAVNEDDDLKSTLTPSSSFTLNEVKLDFGVFNSSVKINLNDFLEQVLSKFVFNTHTGV